MNSYIYHLILSEKTKAYEDQSSLVILLNCQGMHHYFWRMNRIHYYMDTVY
jgi:hypothetical protein